MWHSRLRSPPADGINGVVCRCVVDEDHICRGRVSLMHRPETRNRVVSVVEAWDDDRPGRGIKPRSNVPAFRHSRGAGAAEISRRWYAVIAAPARRKKLYARKIE